MDIKNKKLEYFLEMVEGENIKILINDVPAFNETVGTGYISQITFRYHEKYPIIEV